MHGSATLTTAAAALLATGALGARITQRQAGGAPCKDVHIFLAKGNNEPYPGRQGKLAAAICSGLPSCDYEDIQFYNPLESSYCGSVIEGVANGIKQIKAYNARCPDAKLVLSGYSQGAHVAGDILGGGGGTFFEDCQIRPSAPLGADTPAAKKIVAAMVFGDMRHTAYQSYNYLDGGDKNGVFPRPANELAELNKYAGVMRNYCDATDPVCAGGDVVDNHLNYFDLYSDSAGEWVREMVSKAAGGSPSPTTSAAESSTSTAAPPTSTSTKAPATSAAAATSTVSSGAEPSSGESRPETTTTSKATTATSTKESTSPSEPTGETDAPTASDAEDSTSTSGEAAASSTDAGSGASIKSSLSAAVLAAFIGLLAL